MDFQSSCFARALASAACCEFVQLSTHHLVVRGLPDVCKSQWRFTEVQILEVGLRGRSRSLIWWCLLRSSGRVVLRQLWRLGSSFRCFVIRGGLSGF